MTTTKWPSLYDKLSTRWILCSFTYLIACHMPSGSNIKVNYNKCNDTVFLLCCPTHTLSLLCFGHIAYLVLGWEGRVLETLWSWSL